MPQTQTRRHLVAGTLALGALSTGLARFATGARAQAVATPAADGATVTVVHAQGETVVPVNPQTVLSFDLSSVDTLDALGIQVAGLPKANPLTGEFARFDTDEYLDIGTLFEPDFEAVNAAQPDLIIVAARSAEMLPELSRIAPTIDLTTSGTDLVADLTTNVNVLAEIFGKQDEAAAALAEIDAQLAALAAAVPADETALVILTSGGEVTAVAPGGFRGGLIYNTLGFAPSVADLEEATHGEAISFEFLLEHDPDWLFVIDRDVATGEAAASAAALLDNEIMHETTAWQNEQIVYVDPFTWYIVGNGLHTVPAMIAEISPAFAE